MNIYHYYVSVYLNGNIVGNVDGFFDGFEFTDADDYTHLKGYLLEYIMKEQGFSNTSQNSYSIGITSLTIVGEKK